MPALQWSSSYSVGNDSLDGDHRIIVTLINQLYDATETGQSRDVVGSIINALAEYVEHHFRREESMFVKGGFPGADGHVALHRNLEEKVRETRDRWLAGEREALGEEMLDLLKKWLTEHILVADKSYGPWIGTAAGDTGGGTGPAAEGDREGTGRT